MPKYIPKIYDLAIQKALLYIQAARYISCDEKWIIKIVHYICALCVKFNCISKYMALAVLCSHSLRILSHRTDENYEICLGARTTHVHILRRGQHNRINIPGSDMKHIICNTPANIDVKTLKIIIKLISFSYEQKVCVSEVMIVTLGLFIINAYAWRTFTLKRDCIALHTYHKHFQLYSNLVGWENCGLTQIGVNYIVLERMQCEWCVRIQLKHVRELTMILSRSFS